MQGVYQLTSHLKFDDFVPVEIPAGLNAEMRQKRVNAGLLFRRIEVIFQLLILLTHGVRAAHFHRSECWAIAWETEAGRCIVARVKDNQRHQNDAERPFYAHALYVSIGRDDLLWALTTGCLTDLGEVKIRQCLPTL